MVIASDFIFVLEYTELYVTGTAAVLDSCGVFTAPCHGRLDIDPTARIISAGGLQS
jgi:hypothetical protein